MKQMTCARMGGPATCNFMVTGNTAKEMADNGMKHVMQAHPDMADKMKTMSKEDNDKWWAMFQKKWDATPEM